MNSNILKIGHRGAMGFIPENTIASIKKALELGVDGIEIDVHKCQSGELVVFHDFTLDRMTNGSGEVEKYSLTQLKRLRVKGEHEIPTLEEVQLRSNKIRTLTVNNPNLKKLRASKNQYTYLDVTNCPQLEELGVTQTLLVSLDVRNGNNNLMADFNAKFNDYLTFILS